MALSPDGTTLASGSCGKIEDNSCKQGEIRLWDTASREPSGQSLKGHTSFVSALAFSPDVERQNVGLWQLGQQLDLLGRRLAGARQPAFNPNFRGFGDVRS